MQLGPRVLGLRWLSRAAGLALVVRGATGYCPVVAINDTHQSLADTQASLSGSQGIHVRAAVTIGRPRAELYRLWRDLTGLPGLLQHVQQIDRLSDRRSRWTAVGDNGATIEWQAELINDVENELVAWRSTNSRLVVHAGSVRFKDAPTGTEVLVHLQYRPTGATLGWLAARSLGHDPAAHVREDLRRMKQQLETGEVATAGRAAPRGAVRQDPASVAFGSEATVEAS